ncbi:MAG: AAA family ATPase, partial [Nanoarchaeota archaeon]
YIFCIEDKMETLTFIDIICKECGIIFKSTDEEATSCLECQFPSKYGKENKSNPQEIIIKPELLDTSKLESTNNHILWRPSEFNQYIGQQSLKNILQAYIKGCKDLNKGFPHFLVDGRAGTGKTTVAYILAKQLGLNFVETVANTIKSPQQLIDLLVKTDGGILFLDELQVINKQVANFILPIMEDFKVDGKPIKQFTLFCATTEKGVLIKKFKPLIDRFRIQKTLDNYTILEIKQLIKNYKEKTYPPFNIEDSIYQQIAENSRITPRIAIRLLESYIFMNKPLKDVFKAYNIIKEGITDLDIKLLSLLNANPKGLGLTTICAYLQTSKENFLYTIESYLIEQGYITITNKRFITTLGQEFLKGL